jgi:glycosyltransferase involved in cell wall biosynthesis
MLRVLHVSAAAQKGGLEVVLLNLLRRVDRCRFIPCALFLEEGPFTREVKETGTETHVIEAGRVREILKTGRAVATITRLIRAQRVDVVHTWNAKAHIYGGLAATIAGVPTLYHLHGVPRPSLSRDGAVSVLSVMIPARVTVACSRYVAEAFADAWLSDRRVVVVHNGVPPNSTMIPEGAGGVREEFGIPVDAPLVLMVSRLQRGKGVHVLVDAAGRVATANPRVHFMIIGGTLFGLEEDYPAILQDQVSRLGLRSTVCLAGHRSDVTRFFSTADVVVHPSIQPEAFGMVLAEAMAAGKPVIASDLGGAREIVQHGVTGLLVPPKNPDMLAQAILTLLRDPDRRVQMGRAGAARVQARFSVERMVGQLQALYEEMLGRDSAA